ncbi:hypothetical protein BGZ76_003378 [Entomortierella beljakovae]|nr:hypothetical protein BGZ76_003378 [Entomortierella beljakovae]
MFSKMFSSRKKQKQKARSLSSDPEYSGKIKAEKNTHEIVSQSPPKPDFKNCTSHVGYTNGPSWTYDVSTSTWMTEKPNTLASAESSGKASGQYGNKSSVAKTNEKDDVTPPGESSTRQRKGDNPNSIFHSYKLSMETIPEHCSINPGSDNAKNSTVRDYRTTVETVPDEELPQVHETQWTSNVLPNNPISSTNYKRMPASLSPILSAEDKLAAIYQNIPLVVPTQCQPRLSPNGRGRKPSLVKVSTRPGIARSMRAQICNPIRDHVGLSGSLGESDANISTDDGKLKQQSPNTEVPIDTYDPDTSTSGSSSNETLQNTMMPSSSTKPLARKLNTRARGFTNRECGTISSFDFPLPPTRPPPAIPPKHDMDLSEMNNKFNAVCQINQPMLPTTTTSTSDVVGPSRTITGHPIDTIDVVFTNRNSELLSSNSNQESSSAGLPRIILPEVDKHELTRQMARDIIAAGRNNHLQVRQNAREYIPVTYPTPPASFHSEGPPSQHSFSSESPWLNANENNDIGISGQIDDGASTNVHMVPSFLPKALNGSRFCIGDSVSNISSAGYCSQVSSDAEIITAANKKTKRRSLGKRLWDKIKIKSKKNK